MESDLMDNLYKVKIEMNKLKEYLQDMIKIIKEQQQQINMIIPKIGNITTNNMTTNMTNNNFNLNRNDKEVIETAIITSIFGK